MKTLNDKVAVITGAGSGIGKCLALQLATQGVSLALNDWNASNLEQTMEEVRQAGAEVWGKAFDVSQREEVYRFAEDVQAHFGQIDIVVNNAGITQEQRMVERVAYDDFEKIINVNLWGVVYGTKAFLPYLRQRSEASLVNVSSIFGMIGYPNQGPYVASKFAVRGFTETLRIELAKTKIAVTCVHPGGIKTNIVRNIATDNPKRLEQFAKIFDRMALTSADEAARQIVEGIQKKKKRVIIGPDARKLDFFSRLFPSTYEYWIFKNYDVEKFSAPQQ